jgi:hypothetical protein
MHTFQVTITSMPMIKEKSLAFKVSHEDETFNAIGFYKDLQPEFKNTLLALEVGDTIAFAGRKKLNKYTGMEELIIEKPAQVQQIVVEPLVPVEERIMPDRKYSYLDPRTKQKQEFWSDGIYAWREGQKNKKAKLTYNFLENYNNLVVSDKWLIPDWYAVEMAKKMQENELHNKLMAEFATY